jgi:2-C-methyl-D-erythritol 2,4-cyclodiphosphate synthase
MSRVGFGYDVHPFTEGRRLILGGVEIPDQRGLDGHSDADVLLHAIADALLGAAGLGDIGTHFPPSDERWRDADSRDLLAQVGRLLAPHWVIVHIDATVIAENPRVNPYREAMRAAIAKTLGVPPNRINLKGKTNERLGFIGREEGICAIAVATLEPSGTGQ